MITGIDPQRLDVIAALAAKPVWEAKLSAS